MGNTTKTTLFASLAVVAIAVLFVSSHSTFASQKAVKPIQVRWLLSHQPVDVFARATKVFADELSKDSNGELSLVVITPPQLGFSNKGDTSQTDVMDALNSGKADLASTYTVALGASDSDFWSVNLPFLFANYDETAPVLDGPVGAGILNGLSAKLDAHALAFTMSGGFRIIASKNTEIKTPADLAGKHIVTSGGPVAEATLKALGAVPVSADLESGNPVDLSNVDGIETTYARLSGVVGNDNEYTKYINETNHSLFLTSIIAGNTFYDSLSPQNKIALQKAALAAAKVEREDSIALNASTKAALVKDGSTVTVLSPEAKAQFVAKTKPVYTQFETTFGKSLIDSLVGGH